MPRKKPSGYAHGRPAARGRPPTWVVVTAVVFGGMILFTSCVSMLAAVVDDDVSGGGVTPEGVAATATRPDDAGLPAEETAPEETAPPTTKAPVITEPPTTEPPATTKPKPRVTAPPTTKRPKPKPATTRAPEPDCHPSYSGACLEIGTADYDCAGGSGNGPNYVAGPIRVRGDDPYDLDRDGDGVACE